MKTIKPLMFQNVVAVFSALLLFTCLGANAQNKDGWRQLFNGKDLNNGWKHVGPGSRYVKDGLTGSKGGMGLEYWSKEKFSNCVIRIVYKMEKFNSNSGVFIRIPIEPREEWMPVFYGYEVQIDNHPETSGEPRCQAQHVRRRVGRADVPVARMHF